MKVYVEANIWDLCFKMSRRRRKNVLHSSSCKKIMCNSWFEIGMHKKKSLTKIIWVGWMNSFFFQWIQISPKKVCLCYFRLGKVIQYSKPNLNRSQKFEIWLPKFFRLTFPKGWNCNLPHYFESEFSLWMPRFTNTFS